MASTIVQCIIVGLLLLGMAALGHLHLIAMDGVYDAIQGAIWSHLGLAARDLMSNVMESWIG